MKRACSRVLTVLCLLLVFQNCGSPVNNLPEKSESSKKVIKTYTLGGAPIGVTVELSSAEIDITDYLTLTIRAEFDPDIELTPPFLAEPVYNPLLLVESPKEKTYWTKDNSRLINEWSFLFEPTESGEFALKPFSVYFRLKKEKSDDFSKWPVYQIATDQIPYRIRAVDVSGDEDIRDIKGLILPPFNFIPLIITLLLLVLGSIGTWYFWKARNRKESPPSPLAQPDYVALALNKLKELEQRDLINQEKFDLFHTELSGLLRYFIENHLGLRPVEQTTEEFIREIAHSQRFTLEQKLQLEQFLKLADLVKFATFDPGSETSREALTNVRNFILSTGKKDAG